LVGLAGCRPAATHFLLLRQKKVSKEKATLLSATLRFATGTLRCSVQPGSRANSPSAQTSTSPDPSGLPLLSADRRAGGGEKPIPTAKQPNSQTAKHTQPQSQFRHYEFNSCLRPPSLRKRHFCIRIRFRSRPHPVLAEPVLRRKSGIRAARCLSEASLRGPPLLRRSAGCPKRSVGTRTAGRLSFAYFSLAKQRKVSCRRATPGQPNHAKPT
jgi:hypothetical protein